MRVGSQFTQQFGLLLCVHTHLPVVFGNSLLAGEPDLSQASVLCCLDFPFSLLIGLMEGKFEKEI